MNQATIMTIDGPGVVLERDSAFGQTQYRVAGNGFEGWYSARDILSDSAFDDDETSTMVPEEDPHAADGTELPWNPEPTAEFDGTETLLPDGDKINIDPTNSTKDLEQSDPYDHNKVFGSARPAMRQYIALLESDEMIREAAWSDVRKKAKRIFNSGGVIVESNSPREIIAKVDGDHDRYDTQVHRKNAFGQGVTWWNCDCEWGKTAYTRKRTFIGRMCAHALAAYFALQAGLEPARNVTRIDDRTERHALGYASDPETHDPMNDVAEVAEDLSGPVKPITPGGTKEALNADEREVLSYVRKESLAATQGGLMVWDDDLSKVVKQLYQGQPPAALGADPGMPPGAGAPDPAGDPNAVPGGIDPSVAPDADPSAGFGDPTQGDQNGAGVLPGGAVPPFVRSTTGPTTPDPSQAVTASSTNFPARVTRRHQFSEFTDGDPANNFEEWGSENADDALVFNTVQELDEDNDPEEAFYDGEESPIGRTSTYKPEELGLVENDSVDGHENPYSQAAAEAWLKAHPGQKLPKAFKHKASADPYDEDHSWQKNQEAGEPEEYFEDDLGYHDTDSDEDNGGWTTRGTTSKRVNSNGLTDDELEILSDDSDVAGRFSSYEAALRAEEFNDEADDIVSQFQRSAAANGLTRSAGKNFSYAEQQELIDEQGVASQLGSLNLANSFYE